MSEFKGTKGKWEVNNEPSNGLIDSNRAFNISSDIGLVDICAVWKDVSNNLKESEANAKLIATAPEMLQMLQKINYFINVNKDKNYMIELLSREVKDIEQLLKKATE